MQRVDVVGYQSCTSTLLTPMTRNKEKGWLESKLQDQEFQRLLAREDFVEDFLSEVHRVMTEKKVTRAELARRMNCRPANITQLFRRTRNLTAAMMVDIAFHLGVRVHAVVERGLPKKRRASLIEKVVSAGLVNGAELTNCTLPRCSQCGEIFGMGGCACVHGDTLPDGINLGC